MSNNKRYYWIKLQDDYFYTMKQRKMRKQENGTPGCEKNYVPCQL